ncbi:spermine oxidase [Octopus bimaculoides]|uniref:Amine oxidase domain-containing protein n=1 Tax=Octopus bimaculoides TaxID=37653 RepID=A0A0L8GT97_OCTBM|nr:spermine oxidase [Octopus bimaculoides]|eukprot:XP_014778480.1 PREDICTED: spermine oxidase-like [Octopus bimaculoides]
MAEVLTNSGAASKDAMSAAKLPTTTSSPATDLTKTASLTIKNGVQPKIVIIGAGIAGISAAEYLIKNGFTDITILEASNRTGGRIWTISDEEGRKAEMGANWIHGIEKNPIYQIAESNELLQLRNKNKTLRHKRLFLQEDGTSICGEVLNKVDLAFGQCMVECEAFFKDDLDIPGNMESVGDYIDQDLYYHLDNLSYEERKRFLLVYEQRVSSECIINGCNSLFDVSLSDIGSYEELPGIHYTIPPGFEKVIEILKSNIPPNSILLNHPVRCIHWARPVNCENREHPVCVECENQELFQADHVIVTVSLGVLKAACNRMFNPQIPNRKLLAIDHLGFGIVDKIILEFDRSIIDSDTKLINLLWNSKRDSNKENFRSPNLGDTWVRGITSFEVIHKNVLLGWLCGSSALYMESLTEEQVAKDCAKVLGKFLQNPNIPLPKVIRTRWGNNPYTRGSYSYIHIHSHIEDIYTLQEPLQSLHSNNPQVLFAGEATHECFYSTTHGALLTGWREAERIKDMYTLSTSSSSSPSNTTISSTAACCPTSVVAS